VEGGGEEGAAWEMGKDWFTSGGTPWAILPAKAGASKKKQKTRATKKSRQKATDRLPFSYFKCPLRRLWTCQRIAHSACGHPTPDSWLWATVNCGLWTVGSSFASSWSWFPLMAPFYGVFEKKWRPFFISQRKNFISSKK
jgi:hypothetical protein